MSGFVDTHLHLDSVAGAEAALAEAVAAGVTRVITVGTDLGSSRWAVGAAQADERVLAAVGHHPTSPGPPDLDAFRELAGAARVVALGEVGLDAASPERQPLDDQLEWLRGFCRLGLATGLPLCLHTRETTAPLLAVLAEHPGLTGVCHYFAGGWEEAQHFLELGFHLSFSGLVTRPSREGLREVARRCPAERLLLETDAPYGTPQGRSRQPNRPAWLLDTARLVADLRGMALDELARLEAANASRLFGLNSEFRC